jgi:hypothetical protein
MELSTQDEIKILEGLGFDVGDEGVAFQDMGDYVQLSIDDSEEFNIFPNYEAAKEAAKESMQNLFDDIGIEGWNSDFVRNYYTIREGDIRFLVDDMVEAEREAIEDELQSAVENDPTGEGMNIEDEVEDRLEDMRRDYERKLSDDPKDFLVEELGYYSEEDFFKQSFVDYDLDRLFEDSIDIDGIAHTLAAYDGEETTVDDYHIYRWN